MGHMIGRAMTEIDEVYYTSCLCVCVFVCLFVFFFQAEDGIRYLVRSRGVGDVYKGQGLRLAVRAQ